MNLISSTAIGLRVVSGSACVGLCCPMLPCGALMISVFVRMISLPGPDRMSPLALVISVLPIGFSM